MSAHFESSCESVRTHLADATGSGQVNGFIRRLFDRAQVFELLGLSPEEVQKLIDTRQITPIKIAGRERFDSLEIYGLIETYKRTAMRHAATANE